MIKNDPRYKGYHLVNEMFETVDYIAELDFGDVKGFIDESVRANMPLMLTGEGSSRIFPARNAVHRRLFLGTGPLVLTESSTDLAGKKLADFIVIGASNSGKTKELVNLFRELNNSGHKQLYGLSCNRDSLLEKYSTSTLLIDVGVEKAVAATKSVIAQALFYDMLLLSTHLDLEKDISSLSVFFEQALNGQIDSSITDAVCKADMIFFTGNNNGVAEELALKTNEIIRKKSSFLPGTYLLHGVEEVITSNDVIIMVDSYPDEFAKIRSIYSDSIGAKVIAFSSDPTPFNTVRIPPGQGFHEPYIKLAAGWNLLVEAGIKLGTDLDKPARARKIGNEAF